MTLEAWLRGRTSWLLGPVFVGNTVVVALALLYASAVMAAGAEALGVFVLLAVVLSFVLQLALAGALLGRLRAFRGVAAGRLSASAEHRLAAVAELRRLPASVSRLLLAGWVGATLLLAALFAALHAEGLGNAARAVSLGVLFGPLTTVLVSLLVTSRAHVAIDRLAEGLPPHDVLSVAPPPHWSVRGRLVAFTLLLTVLPAAMLLDVVRTGTAHAAERLVTLPPQARPAAAEVAMAQLTLRLVLLGLCALAFAGVAAAAGGGTIAGPMQLLADEATRIAGGRLSRPRVIAADGEVWRVTGVFAQLHERLAELVGKVLGAGASVGQASTALQQTATRSEVTMAEQSAALNQTSATTEELAQSARQIAGSAAAVQELARKTLESAEQGQADAKAFQAAVDRMKQDNRSIAAAVDRLQRRVQQIGRIVELINTVADRSDLLALSAELEGTRAGDVGRGFALVGAEMRRLAENVLESTAEVEELIAEIRDATQRTAEATAHGSSLTEHGTSLADGVTDALSRVAELARDTSTEVRTITFATQQQQSSTDQLAEAMGDILSGTQQELVTSQRLVEVNGQLIALSTDLATVVSRFKPGNGDR